jgi:hypothetical protein
MKTVLPWLVAVLALGGGYFLYHGNQTKSAAIATLQKDLQQLEALRAENTELKSQFVPPDEVAQLRKDREDLLRLRNEVRQLRDERQQLAKQAQSAQASALQAKAESQRAQEQAQALAQAQTQLLARAQEQQTDVINACINNLRQIDAAAQQWALENQKTAVAVPTARDLSPYFKDGVMPTCPGGGKYTLNAMSVGPTCSIAGHVLP